MFDTAFVNPSYISQIPKMCEENPELRIVYITDDMPAVSLFNAKYWPGHTLIVINALVNNED
jgi:hypothetical protein